MPTIEVALLVMVIILLLFGAAIALNEREDEKDDDDDAPSNTFSPVDVSRKPDIPHWATEKQECRNLHGEKVPNIPTRSYERRWNEISSNNFFREGAEWSGRKVLEVDFVAYKATREHIVKLVIPAGSMVVNPRMHTDKMRASKAIVKEFYDPSGYESPRLVDESIHRGGFLYKKGEEVSPDDFDPSLAVDCSHGIHFFSTFTQARKWWNTNSSAGRSKKGF